jgi:acetyl/propionyl-CoA carboxylase alpha subunit
VIYVAGVQYLLHAQEQGISTCLHFMEMDTCLQVRRSLHE